MDIQKMKEKFVQIFGGEQEKGHLYFAPGRVNLIGEHTDYNGGHVLPCALNLGTYGMVRKREDTRLRFYSLNFSDAGVIESDLNELEPNGTSEWTNYPKGMIWSLKKHGITIDCGMDLLIWGTIPSASGLSSSASVEILTGVILREEFKLRISNLQIALLGQYCEHQYNGVNCGIMDQFAVAMGLEGQAIYLDTNTLQHEYVPLSLGDYSLVIACSNKKRGLADSKYNERRAQCEQALSDLQKVVHVDSLGDLTEEQFSQYESAIGDDVCRRRARHAVFENQRTIQARRALQKNDLAEFGRLMKESHISLRDDYEVTGVELDTLAETAWQLEGVIGSRMTGAGFGGCTVNLVRQDCVQDMISQVGKIYLDKIGYAADFYEVSVGSGPMRIM